MNYVLEKYQIDGDSYRSPWTNKYDPPIEDGFLPSAKLRLMEIEFNESVFTFRFVHTVKDLFPDCLMPTGNYTMKEELPPSTFGILIVALQAVF